MSRIDAIVSAIAAEAELLSISRADSIMIALSYSRSVEALSDCRGKSREKERACVRSRINK